MFFDELEKDNNSQSVSPLNHDYNGRFSRKGCRKNKKIFNFNIIESLLVFIFCFCLLATDFILFAGSGNIEIFKNSIFPTSEILLGMAFIAAVVGIIILLLHRYVILKYCLAAFIAFGFIYAIFTQFAQIQQNIALGHTLHLSSYLILGIVFAGITYVIFKQKYLLLKSLLTVAVVVLFINVSAGYIHQTEPHEFVESYNSQKLSHDKNKRFIYFLFPNLVSYPYLNDMNISEAHETKNIIQGFYQKNNFKVYTQAYAPEQNYLDNMIISFNPLSSQTTTELLLKTKLLSDYWRFQNLKNEYIYLKHNQLYDIFHKNKFQISAYKSRDFDMCHVKHKVNVNRCIEKINQPTNIYSMSLSTLAKTKILMVEWIASWHILTNMSSIYNALATVIDADKVPLVGVDYNNLYVVNSIKTFDVLLEDIKKDTGRQAYFVFVDIPSNMYIYDEYCQLKPQENWFDMANLPWIKMDYTEQRQTAYLQQTKCLYGKLEQFIENLQAQNLWEDTIVVIQGISGVNNFQNYKYTKFLDNFIANRLVTMAIHDKNIKNTATDKQLCSTDNILTKYLFHPNMSCNLVKLGIHGNLYETLQKKLDTLTEGSDVDYQTTFTNWYRNWQHANEATLNSETDILININSDDEILKNDVQETNIEENFGLEDFEILQPLE